MSLELSPLVGKRQYLLTYSQANVELFPTRESFGTAIAEEFNVGPGKVKVDYWACCQEPHENGGLHYHCSVKLTGSKKWFSVKKRLHDKYNIQVNFSDKHDFYLSSYRYVCKTDKDVAHSDGHPQGLLLAESPQTKKCIKAAKEVCRKRRINSGESSKTTKKKAKRLSATGVSTIVKNNNIKSYTQLLAIAKTRQQAGQSDLFDYVLNRTEKHLHELVKKTWDMELAETVVQNQNLTRMDMLRVFLEQTPCTDPCNGQWLDCAKEILVLSGIPVTEFAQSLRNLLQLGRGKHRNLLITGPANCGKTFILKPLQVVFKGYIFENPANDKYGWVGADKAKVIMLNDFRWSKELIPWKDLLLLLEGEPVNLPAPKNIYSEDVSITSDIPIFATSKGKIRYRGSYGSTDEVEDQMMNVRWKFFEFKHPFDQESQKDVLPCPKCFCNLVFSA